MRRLPEDSGRVREGMAPPGEMRSRARLACNTMMLTLEGRDPCLLCGCQLRSWYYPTAVINKRSIRRKDGYHLSAADWECPECWTPAIVPMRTVYRLTADSAAEVAAYRARRWPAR